MDHTHFCWTRVSTNHLESQIDFLPFDGLTKQSIRIHQQKTIGQFSPVINAWSGFSAPSVVAVVISIVGKVSLTRKSFKLFYLSTTVLLSHVVSSQTKVSSAPLEYLDVCYAYRLHAIHFLRARLIRISLRCLGPRFLEPLTASCDQSDFSLRLGKEIISSSETS